MNISGQTAIVTGGASGLGEATARQLAAAGAKVGILDMNEELAQKVAAEIGGAAAVCDVVDPASHEAAVAQVRDALGPARIMVACAGIAPGAKLVGRDGNANPLERLTRAVHVNLIGTINSCRLAAAGHGRDGADGRQRARLHHHHRLGRGLRGPDRPARLRGVEGRRRGDDDPRWRVSSPATASASIASRRG